MNESNWQPSKPLVSLNLDNAASQRTMHGNADKLLNLLVAGMPIPTKDRALNIS